MADLCDVCANLELSPSAKEQGHGTWTSLLKSASTGCPACQVVVCGVVNRLVKSKSCETEQGARQQVLELDRYLRFGPSLVPSKSEFAGFEQHQVDRLVLPEGTELSLTSLRGDHGHVVRRRTQDHVSFDLAKQWIDECSKQHQSCNHRYVPVAGAKWVRNVKRILGSGRRNPSPSIQDRTLPTRVVDIGSDTADAKLVETKGKKGKYLCLSHCWGGQHPTMTTRANYEEHLAGMPWSSLSRTIQDALTATRELGYRYIWIDSLCIIQHDRDDWIREGSRMQEIFENCSVAIATPAASNAQSGFLQARSSATLMECPLSGKNEGIVLAVPTTALDVEYDGPSSAKSIQALERVRLFTRGWVLQERLLPHRVLYFGSHELYFECRTRSLRESYWIPANGSPENLHGVQNKDMNDVSDDAQQNDQLSRWLFFVAEYTALGLTNWTDRLPAISGLARKFASNIRGEYVAGLWSDEDLYRQLMWRDCRRLGDERSGFDSKVYVAPSWSWASSWGRVLFLVTGKHEVLAEVESCKATRATKDPYGQVQSGVLTIKGRVQTFVLWVRRQRTLPEYTVYEPGKPGKVAGVCLFDRDEGSSPEGGLESNTIEVILLVRQKRGFRIEYLGLALAVVSRNPLLYRRVGHFSQDLREQDYRAMWAHVETTRITVV